MKDMSQRQLKVAEEIRHVVAPALLRGDIPSTLPLSRFTVLAVWVSADLRLARIYLDLPAELPLEATLAAANQQLPTALRKVLAKQLATKYIPAVSFHAGID